jgi:hypothetical protein
MKTFAVALALLTLAPASRAIARDHDHDADAPRVSMKCCNAPTRWAPREDTRDAGTVITTDDGDVSLLLTSHRVAVQLSDHTWHKLDRKLREKQDDDEDNVLATAIKQVVISSVRSMFDHSVECRVRDLERVDYSGGRLIFTAENGDRVFENLEVNDRDVMASFTERDARAFVRAFRAAKSRLD